MTRVQAEETRAVRWAFWSSEPADDRGMLGSPTGAEFGEDERAEVLSLLPRGRWRRTLELAGGIGRFTGALADNSDLLVTVDLVPRFIDENARTNAGRTNISYVVADAVDVRFAAASFDFIFVNWLLMNLGDEEALAMLERLRQWLAPDGRVFLRESCETPSDPSVRKPASRYRPRDFYESHIALHFETEATGNVKTYERLYGNPNQIWWILKPRGEPSTGAHVRP